MEVFYATEGVCSIIDYKEWRDNLYKAGCADSLVQKDEQRLLTIGELEAVDQYFWEMVFADSSMEQISIEKRCLRYLRTIEFLWGWCVKLSLQGLQGKRL